jgi:hypothetical protein
MDFCELEASSELCQRYPSKQNHNGNKVDVNRQPASLADSAASRYSDGGSGQPVATGCVGPAAASEAPAH